MAFKRSYGMISSPEPSKVYFDGLRCEAIESGVFEVDTVMCGHCGRHIHIKPRMDPADMGGLCKQCMKFECPQCVGKGCTPLEKKIERAEERNRILNLYGSW